MEPQLFNVLTTRVSVNVHSPAEFRSIEDQIWGSGTYVAKLPPHFKLQQGLQVILVFRSDYSNATGDIPAKVVAQGPAGITLKISLSQSAIWERLMQLRTLFSAVDLAFMVDTNRSIRRIRARLRTSSPWLASHPRTLSPRGKHTQRWFNTPRKRTQRETHNANIAQ